LFEEVEQNFIEEILHKKAVIHISGSFEVNVIRFQFRQLLQNLISNSLKFSIPDIPPQINITSSIVSGKKVKNKQLDAHTDYCHIVYTDNGIGFSPEYNERVFQVFQRLHNRSEYKGTGMGLAICRRIIENHHGIITASGKLNKGVQFDMYIPVNGLLNKISTVLEKA